MTWGMLDIRTQCHPNRHKHFNALPYELFTVSNHIYSYYSHITSHSGSHWCGQYTHQRAIASESSNTHFNLPSHTHTHTPRRSLLQNQPPHIFPRYIPTRLSSQIQQPIITYIPFWEQLVRTVNYQRVITPRSSNIIFNLPSLLKNSSPHISPRYIPTSLSSQLRPQIITYIPFWEQLVRTVKYQSAMHHQRQKSGPHRTHFYESLLHTFIIHHHIPQHRARIWTKKNETKSPKGTAKKKHTK